jgi:subtilase family serine protease
VNDTTRNQGGAAAGGSVTRFYLSADPVLGAGDVPLASRTVDPLAAGASSAASTTMTVPAGTTTGTYYVLAQADAAEANVETSEVNNGNRISIRVGPDLIVSSAVVPASMAAGAAVAVTNTIKNQGGSAAASSSTRIFLSTNPSVDASDVLLGTRVVPSLAASATSSVTTTVTIPPGTAAGAYYVVVQADGSNEVVETIETNNNYSTSVRVGPDLRVATGSVPSKVTPGTPFPVTESTMNAGGAPAAASTTRYYLSTNTLFDVGDMLLGGRDVPALAAGATSTATSSLTVPAGTTKAQYYLVIVADADGGIAEVYENNNTLVLIVVVN